MAWSAWRNGKFLFLFLLFFQQAWATPRKMPVHSERLDRLQFWCAVHFGFENQIAQQSKLFDEIIWHDDEKLLATYPLFSHVRSLYVKTKNQLTLLLKSPLTDRDWQLRLSRHTPQEVSDWVFGLTFSPFQDTNPVAEGSGWGQLDYPRYSLEEFLDLLLSTGFFRSFQDQDWAFLFYWSLFYWGGDFKCKVIPQDASSVLLFDWIQDRIPAYRDVPLSKLLARWFALFQAQDPAAMSCFSHERLRFFVRQRLFQSWMRFLTAKKQEVLLRNIQAWDHPEEGTEMSAAFTSSEFAISERDESLLFPEDVRSSEGPVFRSLFYNSQSPSKSYGNSFFSGFFWNQHSSGRQFLFERLRSYKFLGGFADILLQIVVAYIPLQDCQLIAHHVFKTNHDRLNPFWVPAMTTRERVSFGGPLAIKTSIPTTTTTTTTTTSGIFLPPSSPPAIELDPKFSHPEFKGARSGLELWLKVHFSPEDDVAQESLLVEEWMRAQYPSALEEFSLFAHVRSLYLKTKKQLRFAFQGPLKEAQWIRAISKHTPQEIFDWVFVLTLDPFRDTGEHEEEFFSGYPRLSFQEFLDLLLSKGFFQAFQDSDWASFFYWSLFYWGEDLNQRLILKRASPVLFFDWIRNRVAAYRKEDTEVLLTRWLTLFQSGDSAAMARFSSQKLRFFIRQSLFRSWVHFLISKKQEALLTEIQSWQHPSAEERQVFFSALSDRLKEDHFLRFPQIEYFSTGVWGVSDMRLPGKRLSSSWAGVFSAFSDALSSKFFELKHQHFFWNRKSRDMISQGFSTQEDAYWLDQVWNPFWVPPWNNAPLPQATTTLYPTERSSTVQALPVKTPTTKPIKAGLTPSYFLGSYFKLRTQVVEASRIPHYRFYQLYTPNHAIGLGIDFETWMKKTGFSSPRDPAVLERLIREEITLLIPHPLDSLKQWFQVHFSGPETALVDEFLQSDGVGFLEQHPLFAHLRSLYLQTRRDYWSALQSWGTDKFDVPLKQQGPRRRTIRGYEQEIFDRHPEDVCQWVFGLTLHPFRQIFWNAPASPYGYPDLPFRAFLDLLFNTRLFQWFEDKDWASLFYWSLFYWGGDFSKKVVLRDASPLLLFDWMQERVPEYRDADVPSLLARWFSLFQAQDAAQMSPFSSPKMRFLIRQRLFRSWVHFLIAKQQDALLREIESWDHPTESDYAGSLLTDCHHRFIPSSLLHFPELWIPPPQKPQRVSQKAWKAIPWKGGVIGFEVPFLYPLQERCGGRSSPSHPSPFASLKQKPVFWNKASQQQAHLFPFSVKEAKNHSLDCLHSCDSLRHFEDYPLRTILDYLPSEDCPVDFIWLDQVLNPFWAPSLEIFQHSEEAAEED